MWLYADAYCSVVSQVCSMWCMCVSLSVRGGIDNRIKYHDTRTEYICVHIHIHTHKCVSWFCAPALSSVRYVVCDVCVWVSVWVGSTHTTCLKRVLRYTNKTHAHTYSTGCYNTQTKHVHMHIRVHYNSTLMCLLQSCLRYDGYDKYMSFNNLW